MMFNCEFVFLLMGLYCFVTLKGMFEGKGVWDHTCANIRCQNTNGMRMMGRWMALLYRLYAG